MGLLGCKLQLDEGTSANGKETKDSSIGEEESSSIGTVMEQFRSDIKFLDSLDHRHKAIAAIISGYNKGNSEERSFIKEQIRKKYFEVSMEQIDFAKELKGLHRRLVNIESSNQEVFSKILGVQQPHATEHIHEYHKGVHSQLAGNKIMTDMKSDIIKLAPHKKHLKRQGIDSEGYDTLGQLIEHPLYKEVLELPYRVAFFWAQGGGGEVKFKDGLDDAEKARLYDEFYELTKILLEKYNNSGKTFMIGNWEGDWLLGGMKFKKDTHATDEAIHGMIDWYNIRAKGIADAKKEVPHENVRVHFYCELNHVALAKDKGMKRIVNTVLPHIHIDYLSISSYDMQGYGRMADLESPEAMEEATFAYFDYINDLMPPADIPGKRVFTGEVGFTVWNIMKRQKVDRESAEIEQARLALCNAIANLKWDMPFWLWWAVHDNEETKEGPYRGFGIIDQVAGKKRKLCYEMEEFYEWSEGYIENYKEKHGNLPGSNDFRLEAIEQLRKQLEALKGK